MFGLFALIGCESEQPVTAASPIGGAAGSAANTDPPPCGAEYLNFRAGGDGIGLVAVGERGLVQARVIAASPQTPKRFENDWTVMFMDARGAPLNDVEIVDSCAYMDVAGHRHFDPPRRVTRLADASTFMLEAVNLFMRGPWDVQLVVTSPTIGGAPELNTRCDDRASVRGADRVALRTCIMDR